MSLAYVRKAYGVPAKRGGRVSYTGEGREKLGTITGACGGHLRVRLDGIKHSLPFHPTWELQYFPALDRNTVNGGLNDGNDCGLGLHPVDRKRVCRDRQHCHGTELHRPDLGLHAGTWAQRSVHSRSEGEDLALPALDRNTVNGELSDGLATD